jgi:hypothetical protein
MKKNKSSITPDKFNLLSYISGNAADSGFHSFYATANESRPNIIEGKDNPGFVTFNGLVDFDGKDDPYSRKQLREDPYYMCIGCSYSVSAGLPAEYSWTSIIELATGKVVNNCSESGAGYRKLTLLATDMMKKYGKPKHILALMPDAYRFWTPYPWLTHLMNGEMMFGASYWRDAVGSYMYNVMGSGDKVFRFIDHTGRSHIISPELIAFSNFHTLYSFKQMALSMDIGFDCMSWYNTESPNDFNMSKVFNIKHDKHFKNNSKMQTSTEYAEEFIKMEKELGGEGRWRRYGIPSEDGTCDHMPLTENQKKFWYRASNGTHPGLHDQIHYAENMIDTRIPCSILEEMP